MKVWMRGRAAPACTASPQRSMSPSAGAGEAGDRRRSWRAWRSRDTASKSPSEAIGKPGLDDVDAHLVEQLGDFELFLERHRGAGALLAVAQRRVEDEDAVLVEGDRRGDGLGAMVMDCSCLISWSARATRDLAPALGRECFKDP